MPRCWIRQGFGNRTAPKSSLSSPPESCRHRSRSTPWLALSPYAVFPGPNEHAPHSWLQQSNVGSCARTHPFRLPSRLPDLFPTPQALPVPRRIPRSAFSGHAVPPRLSRQFRFLTATCSLCCILYPRRLLSGLIRRSILSLQCVRRSTDFQVCEIRRSKFGIVRIHRPQLHLTGNPGS